MIACSKFLYTFMNTVCLGAMEKSIDECGG